MLEKVHKRKHKINRRWPSRGEHGIEQTDINKNATIIDSIAKKCGTWIEEHNIK